MLRNLLGTRRGFWLVLALEALFLFIGLPRLLKGTTAVIYLATFWSIATLLYFSNYPFRRWLARSHRR